MIKTNYKSLISIRFQSKCPLCPTKYCPKLILKDTFIALTSIEFRKMYQALADKSGDIVDFCGNTSSNRAGAWSHHAFVQLFPITQQYHALSKHPRTSPIVASGATNIKNVISFVRQCKSTPYLIVRTVSHLVPVIHVQLPQATTYVTVDLTHCGPPYSHWTCATWEHPTHYGPPQLWNTIQTFDLSLEKHWRFSDCALQRWWLHA